MSENRQKSQCVTATIPVLVSHQPTKPRKDHHFACSGVFTMVVLVMILVVMIEEIAHESIIHALGSFKGK